MIAHVNSIDIYYEKCGEGEPMVLLHGNGESHDIFDRVMPLLGMNHTLYIPDSRNHGGSSKTDDYSYEAMRDDMIAFIKELGLERPVFYGFSDGGIVGLMIAMKEPDLLGKLIISGANLYPKGLKASTLLQYGFLSIFGNPLNRMIISSPHIAPKSLSSITVPTVVLAGERDCVKRNHTDLIAASIRGSKKEIISGEDHGSYIVNSEKLYEVLEKHL